MPESPYAGLNPFSVEDAPFFFGRDRESHLIVANLMASRLTILYGPSGVGKSSVLNAGALHLLRNTYDRAATDGRPQVIGVAFQKWQVEPAVALERVLADAIGISADGTFSDKLAAWGTKRGGRLLLMLDQFEEYLLYHEMANDDFGKLLPQILGRPNLAVNVLISIREDSVSKLDVFKGRLPTLFQNYLRLDRLTPEAAREAVVGPLERFNEMGLTGSSPVTIESSLVDAVLSDVRAGRLTIGETGRGRVAAAVSSTDDRIETPYLQLVMRRLWDEERGQHSSALRLGTYLTLGRAQRIVESHLEKTVQDLSRQERAAAAKIFEHLVTPGKSKIAHTSADLAKYANIDEGKVEGLLEKLSGPNRILATVAPIGDQSPETRYQIFHDVLASAVLAWTTTYRSRREQRRRILQVAGALAIIAIVVALGVLIRRTRLQTLLIQGYQKNQRVQEQLAGVQSAIQESRSHIQAVESNLALLEKEAQTSALKAAIAQLRKSVVDVTNSQQTLASQVSRAASDLQSNQREIAQSQGFADVVKSAPAVNESATDPHRTAASGAGGAESNPAPPPDPKALRLAAENEVLATLQRYADAYNSLKIERVHAVFPSYGGMKNLEKDFSDLKSYNMTVTPIGPVELTDDLRLATVSCTTAGTFQGKVGARQALKTDKVTFHLTRGESGWIVASLSR